MVGVVDQFIDKRPVKVSYRYDMLHFLVTVLAKGPTMDHISEVTLQEIPRF